MKRKGERVSGFFLQRQRADSKKKERGPDWALRGERRKAYLRSKEKKDDRGEPFLASESKN